MSAAVLAPFAVLASLLMLWQWLAGRRFPLDRRTPPLPIHPHPSAAPANPHISVTLLKPVKGADAGTAEALATWLAQDHPGPIEILFGVDSAEDPAVPLIRDLIARHPGVDARLVVCGERLGINRKVSNLIQLAADTRGELIFVSDADVAAPPDLVGQMAAAFADPGIGLAHCLYRLADAPTPATRWEAFAVNADFWSQVLQNQTIKPLDYALGAAMALRRTDLDALGGFDALKDHLADDNRLGRLVVALGRRTWLCPVVVDCRAAPAGWTEVWHHQLRWAVTIRACQGVPYFFSILANGTVWALAWTLLAHSGPALVLGPAFMAFRIAQGLLLESRFTGRSPDWSAAWVVPLKDILQVGLWVMAFLQRVVVWRGLRFRVLHDGRLVPAGSRVGFRA